MNDWYCDITSPSAEYLSHYGILGMKWGIRRFQNSDGTYTNLGKRRRNGGEGSSEKSDSLNPVRRYQNANGSLTAKGEARRQRDIKENEHKKEKNKVDTEHPDPNRWVKEDRERAKNVVDRAKDATNAASQGLDAYSSLKRHNAQSHKERLDLSDYSDQELRNAVNRELLERQFNDVFNAPETTYGAEKVKDIVQMTGAGLAIVSSGLGIALALKELNG